MAAMLVLLGVATAPSAAADDHQCTISLQDPTNPEWTDSCTKPPDLEQESGHVPSITLILGAHETVSEVDDVANICATPVPCEDLFQAAVSSDAHASEDAYGSLEVSSELTAASHDLEAGASGDGCWGEALGFSLTRTCEKVPHP